MTVTISFRVSEELEQFLEQEAKDRMTTKSTVAQMLLAERVRQIREEPDTNATRGGENNNTKEPESTELLGEAQRVQFPSKDAADDFRDEYPQFVGDGDDLRFKKVSVTADCPVEHLPDGNVFK